MELDLFVQLYSAWLVLVPGLGPLRWLRRAGGGIQAAVLWAGYTNMGADDRDQFEMLETLPGGVASVCVRSAPSSSPCSTRIPSRTRTAVL